jgi:hypothetical protein
MRERRENLSPEARLRNAWSHHMQKGSRMKLKISLAIATLVSMLAVVDAHAACSLAAPNFVARGQFFSYTVDIWDFSPLDPTPAFTIVFYGAKNGVTDILPPGEPYPGVFGYGSHELTGFQNVPSGVFAGSYIRWALVYDRFGNPPCVTNAVNVTLQ